MPAAKSSTRSKRKATRSRSSSTKSRGTKSRSQSKTRRSAGLSARTKKQIDSLPEHAQHIYKQAHASALDQYNNPSKRRGGKSQSKEQVAHKVAWSAVKKEYQKKDGEWVRKE